ncbi:hypothetical protein [Brevundimonas bullata]
MGKALKTVGVIIGAAALIATGVGALALPALAGTTTLFGVSVGTLNTISSGLVAVGGMLDKPKSQGSAAPDEWTSNPDQPIPFLMGRMGVAGKIVQRDEFGPDNMYQGIVGILSGAGPIRAVTSFTGDKQPVTFGAEGIAVSSQWQGEMWMVRRSGAQPDTVLTVPAGLKTGGSAFEWSSAAKLSGKACYLQVLGENSKGTAFPAGIPDPVHVAEGIFGYDPRYDDTYPGGAGTCRLGVRSTYRWIEDGGIGGLNWALGLVENGQVVGGIGASIDGIDVPAFVEVANIADANGWKLAAWPDTSEDVSAVLDQLLQAAGAVRARHAGKISCVSRGAPRASVATITARDTAGDIELDTAPSLFNRLNTITPRFMSEAAGWVLTPANPVSFAQYVTDDGGKHGDQIDYRFVPLLKQAAELAAYDILDAREPFSGTIPLKAHMRHLKRGDTFDIDEPGFLMDGVKCIVLSRSYDPKTAQVRIGFRSETDSKHALALGKTTTLPDFPTLTPTDPTIVSPPQPEDWVIVVRPPATDGTQLPGFDLTGVVSNATADAMLISWRAVAEGEDPDVQPLFTDEDGEILPGWTDAGVYPPTTRTLTIQGPQSGAVIWIAIRYKRGNNYSDAILTGPLTAGTMAAGVVTDTTPPADVAGLALSSTSTPDAAGNPYVRIIATWTANTDEDLNGYEVEITEGSVTVVDYVATNQHSREALTGRTYTFRVRAIDKAGNRSAWTAPQDIVGAGDTTPPGPPTTLEATASVGSIFLRWTNPGASDLAKIEVWENTTNNSGTATKIAVVVGQPSGAGSYSRSGLPSGVTRYYWLKAVDTSGNASGLSTGISATTASIQVTDFASNITAPELMTTVQRLAATPTLGRIVFDTTDGKLYRGTGSAWDRSTDGADITADSITAGQIAAGAISTTELAAGAVTAGKIGAGQVTTTELAAGAVTADKVQAGSITGDRISTSTSLPGTITVGSTGVSIGTIQSQADDPAARVNANSTLITPGRIQIQGGTSLDNWRDGTDINGGSVKTGSIQARSLVLAMRNVQSINNTFRAYPDTNVVGWTGGGIVYQNDSGTTTGVGLSSGSVTYAGTTIFIYWSSGASALSTTTSQSVANGPNNVIMATYNGGALLTVYNGRTLITPEGIVTPSLSAITANIGDVTAGLLRNGAGTTFFDLNNARSQYRRGAYDLRIGSIGTGVTLWYGPTSITIGSETRTNGVWAFGDDGKVYYGSTELTSGGGFHAQANATVRVGSRTSAGSVTTSTVTITTTGATGSVSYAWSQLSGDDTWSITSASGAATAFNTSVSTPGEQKRATFACLVTDAGSGRSFTIIVGAAALYNV